MRHNASSRGVFPDEGTPLWSAVRGAVERHKAGERPPVAFTMTGRSRAVGYEDGEEGPA